MASPQTDRAFGVSSNIAVKAPCRVATVGSDITSTISGGGLITLDGVALAANDRVLVKDQTNQLQNGIYIASTTPWVFDADSDGNNDWAQGTVVYVASGALNAGTWWQQITANPVQVGTSNIVFTQVNMSPGFTATSTTSLTVGTGSQSLTVQASKSFTAGQFVTIADSAAPGTNYMSGSVTSYNSTSGALVVNITVTAGSGTKTAWTVGLAGAQGPIGATGPTGPQGASGSGSGNMINTGASVAGQIPKYTDTSGTAIAPGYTVGTAANNLLALDGSGKVPAVDGSQLTNLPTAVFPPGGVTAYAGSSAPSGWLLCFGQAVSRATYTTLFGVIGTTFGAGDGSTTFNVPDLRGRAAFGVDNMGGVAANRLGSGSTGGITGSATLGVTGGEQSHTLTTSEQAAMSVSGSGSFLYDNGSASGSGSVAVAPTGALATTQPVSFTGTASGGGGGHNNVPPTIVLNFIVKT